MSRDARRIKQAFNITRLSEHRFPIAAILYKGSVPISVGVNKYKSHPRQINHHTRNVGTSLHAELDCILGVDSDELRGSVLYVVRRLYGGKTGMARPCISCMDIIETVGIKRVVYTTDSGFTSEDV